jgi:hypothetical protein
MFGFSAAHMLIFGIVALLLFGNRLPQVIKSLRQRCREIHIRMREFEHDFRGREFRNHHRGAMMRKHWNKFLWTWKFWALLGAVGCVSGLYFQRVAENGSGLWCLGLIFLGAAYLEQQE